MLAGDPLYTPSAVKQCVFSSPLSHPDLSLPPRCSVLVRSSTNGINWRQYQGFKFLLSGTVIAAFWALCMLIFDLLRLCTGRGIRGLGTLAIIVLGEWVRPSTPVSSTQNEDF